MNKKITLLKRISLVILLLFTLTTIIYRNNQDVVDASTQTEYLKKGDGSYLTYRGSSEKVLTLKEYNNPIQQYRAVWISHFAGDISAYQDAESYKKDLTTIMDNMETWGMNAMVFHIRTHNNAMYDSKLNPRARWWANVDFDEFDPLKWLIDECHKRGIEFHAWMNPYRLGDSNVVGEYPEGNPANDPSLHLSNGDGKILDPSSQVVRDFIVDTCMEVIENYDVDAIHFDDYFYISGVETSKSGDWKREQVNLFIKQLHDEMTAYNEKNGKNVQLGISPSGIYRNGGYVATPTYDANGNLLSPIGSYTSGFAHYDNYLYSDTLHWINEGWIDYITPQSYWGLEHNVASYAALTRWWSWATTNKDVNLYMGMGIYMAIDGSGYWNKDQNEVNKQLLNAGMYSEIDGICVYKYASLLSSNATVKKGVETFKNYWGTKRVPSAVQKSYADKLPSYTVDNLCLIGNDIVWDEVSNVRGYMVYKVLKGDKVDVNNIDHLVEYTQSTSIKADDTDMYDYYVATVNKANVISDVVKLESGVSNEPHVVVINRINALPSEITLEDENNVNNVVKLYDNLNAEQKTLVTNYNILQAAVKKISDIKNLQVTMDTYIKTLSNDLVDKVPLKAPENMSWSYKNLSDAVAYNLTTGEILGTYLNKKITLLLNASIPNSNISYTKEVTFNASVISSNYVGLFYRNDASCMTPVDSGEYGPDNSKYIGWSNYILYVGNYALPVATGNFFEVTSSSNVTKVNWTSCGGLYINKTGSAWTFTPNDLFHSESPAYGYIVIGTNGKLRVVSDTTDYTAQITLQANEAIFVTRYLERTIDGTPYTSITTNFNTSTDAQIVKVESKEFNNVVQTLIDIINGLPTEITLSDEKTVKDAEQIYSSLSDEEKALVTNYSKLEAAIAKIEELNGEAYQFMLKQEEAKQEVLNYVSLNDYSKENQSAIKRYQLVANQGIEGAKTEEQLNKAVQTYKQNVDSVKTLAQELVEEKEIVKENLKNYPDLSNYTALGQRHIQDILATVDARVASAKSKGELDLIESAIVAEIDAVLTMEEELEEMKYELREAVFGYFDPKNYPLPSANALETEAVRVSLEISKATSISQVEIIVENYCNFIENYITLEDLATLIETEKANLTNIVDEKYLSDSRMNSLIENTKNRLNNVLTYQEIENIKAEFNTQYSSLKITIDSEQKQQKDGCLKFNYQFIALTGVLSLALLVLRKKGN